MATDAEIRIAKADTPARYADFQKLMFRAVTRPVTKDDFANPKWDDGRDANALFSAFVKGDGFRTPLERVQTYNRMYWYRTLDSLWEDFPGVRAIVGKKFMPLAEAYLEKHPSTSFTLRHLGREFPAWLRENSAKLPASVASAAAECAAVEWALCAAFENEACPPADAEKFSDPAKARLALQPHLTLLALSHDIPGFLSALRAAESDPSESGNAAVTSGPGEKSARRTALKKPKRTETFAVVFRTTDNRLATVVIGAAEHALLADLASGVTLGRALDRIASRRDAPDVTSVGRWFSAWAARGWLTERRATRRLREIG